MRIALIGPVYPYRGGIAHYTTLLYRALSARHDVLLVSFKRQYPNWLFPGQSDKDPSKRRQEVDKARYWIDSLNPFTWLSSFWRVRRYQPDAVILQWWTSFWAPVWILFGLLNRCFLRRPLVYICHNVLPHEERFWDVWLARSTLHWGARFIVQSNQEEEKLLSLVPDARVSVYSLPPFSLFGNVCIPRDQAREELGLPVDVPVLLFFGIVRQYKGLSDLLSAMPLIRSEVGEVILIIAGEFWDEKSSYVEQIERLGIGDSIIVEDRYIPNEEVILYFSAAEILVAPYRRVTGSGVVQVALSCGCPVITTAVGGMVELVEDADGVVLVAPGDPVELASQVSHCLREKWSSRTGRAASPLSSSRKSDWDQLIATIEKMI